MARSLFFKSFVVLSLVSVTLALPATLSAGDLEATVSIGGGSALPGGSVTLPLFINGTHEIQGCSLSIDFDEEVLEATAIDKVWARPDGEDWLFFAADFDNANASPGNGGIDEGWLALAVVFTDFSEALLGLPVFNPPADTDNEIVALSFNVRTDAPAGSTGFQMINGGRTAPGGQPVDNVVTLLAQTAKLPELQLTTPLFVNGVLQINSVGPPEIHIGTSAALGAVPGQRFSVPIVIDATQIENITGFSLGVSHETDEVELVGVEATDEMLDLLGLPAGSDPAVRSFYHVDMDPAGGAGFVAAVLFGQPQTAEPPTLSPGLHHLLNAEYRALDGMVGSTAISVKGGLGSPAVPLVLDINGGQMALPVAESSVDVPFGVPFRRGDASGDGRYDLRDGLAILKFLFRGGEMSDCPPTFNFDGSTNAGDRLREDLADIAINDGILILRYAFNVAPATPPASPFPACDQPSVPAVGEAVCREFDSCP